MLVGWELWAEKLELLAYVAFRSYNGRLEVWIIK